MKAIDKTNKLIAEFMGAKFFLDNNEKFWAKDNFSPYSMDTYKMLCDLKYDCRWDWIMPVVEKIEILTHPMYTHHKMRVVIGQAYVYIDCGENTAPEVTVVGKTKLEAVYQAVVDVIKWYKEDVE